MAAGDNPVGPNPTDAEYLQLSEKAFNEALPEVNELWRTLKAAGKDASKPLPFTRGRSLAIRAIFAKVIGQMVLGFAISAARRDALEARVAALEAANNLSYKGTYNVGNLYRPGHFVTHRGSLWHCNATTQDEPGNGDRWTLAAKRGRDGRDAR